MMKSPMLDPSKNPELAGQVQQAPPLIIWTETLT